MSAIPTPPSGPVPAFVHHRNMVIAAFIGSSLALATITVALRLYVRARIVHSLGWDDLFVVLGLASGILTCVCSMIITLKQQEYLGPTDFLGSIYVFVELTSAAFSLTFARISICLFLLRFFKTDKRWKRTIYGIMALVVISLIVWVVTSLSWCPASKMFHPAYAAECSPFKKSLAVGYYQGAMWAFTDFVLAALPSVFIWKIRVSTWGKSGLVSLMCLGVITGICTIMRIIRTDQFEKTLAKGAQVSTWKVDIVTILAYVELGVTLIAACLPVLLPLFRNVRPRHGTVEEAIPAHQRPRTRNFGRPMQLFRATNSLLHSTVKSTDPASSEDICMKEQWPSVPTTRDVSTEESHTEETLKLSDPKKPLDFSFCKSGRHG